MKPLFILPFDHRSGFLRELFGLAYPPTPAVAKKVIALKNVIFDGFLLAQEDVEHIGEAGILVDEEFGSNIITKAQALDISVSVSTEKSGVSSFAFVHGKGFGRRLAAIQPTYAKALVNYTIDDDELNEEKLHKLRKLSDFCQEEHIPLMLEPLLHGSGTPLSRARTMMQDFHGAGIFPALWKIEGLPSASDWRKLEPYAKAPMIVLGRGQSKADVEDWLQTAARSGVVDGFAVGRTIFMEPLKRLVAKKITKSEAAAQIAKNYLHFVKLWKKEAK